MKDSETSTLVLLFLGEVEMSIQSNNLDPRYLRGVIDALELVASFLAWKAEHPNSTRTIKEFLEESLEQLEKKTHHKLDEVLGIELGDE